MGALAGVVLVVGAACAGEAPPTDGGGASPRQLVLVTDRARYAAVRERGTTRVRGVVHVLNQGDRPAAVPTCLASVGPPPGERGVPSVLGFPPRPTLRATLERRDWTGWVDVSAQVAGCDGSAPGGRTVLAPGELRAFPFEATFADTSQGVAPPGHYRWRIDGAARAVGDADDADAARVLRTNAFDVR